MPPVPRWLPNAISLLRVGLVPVWAAVAELANRAAERGEDVDGLRGWAVAVLLTIGLSDILDGFVARRFGLESALGATLDAVADKLSQVVTVTYLALRTGPAFASMPLWFLLLLIARDAILLAGTLAVRSRRGEVRVEHQRHGRAASVLLFLLLLAFTSGHGAEITWPLLGAIAVLVAWSAGLYVRDGVRQVWR